MKFSVKDFSSKCDQILRKLGIWSNLLEKSIMENFIFCAVIFTIINFNTSHWRNMVYKASWGIDPLKFLGAFQRNVYIGTYF